MNLSSRIKILPFAFSFLIKRQIKIFENYILTRRKLIKKNSIFRQSCPSENFASLLLSVTVQNVFLENTLEQQVFRGTYPRNMKRNTAITGCLQQIVEAVGQPLTSKFQVWLSWIGCQRCTRNERQPAKIHDVLSK